VANNLKILLFEYVSGGGFAKQLLPSGLLSEGFGMLRGLTADFKAAGHNLTIMLDSRLADLKPPLKADRVIPVYSEDITQVLINASKDVEAAFVIAPEPNNVLVSMVKHVETLGVLSLNCQADAITLAADKATLYERVKCLGLDAPETFLFNIDKVKEIMQKSHDLGFPVVVKPVNGAGCSGLSITKNEREVAAAVNKIRAEAPNSPILVQKLIKGVSASVSLISTGSEAVPVSLNKQDVKLAAPDSVSSYNGGMVPLDNHLSAEAFATAKRVVESFSGLRGYVGVDLILAEDEVFVIEVNPRLTTSYVGLREVSNFNPAQAILNVVLKKELPPNVTCKGCSYFSKVPVPASLSAKWIETCTMPQVVSPPFPIASNGVNYTLVESHADIEAEALIGFSEAKKRLQRIFGEG
jgi:predicted ATP-grasp superfamily ATP-dependent carboligase